MLGKYPDPLRDRRVKLTPTEREFIANDKVTSKVLLAQQFDVNPRLIDFIQNPHKYHENNEKVKAYRKRQRALNPKPARPRKPRTPRPKPVDPYLEKIHKLIAEGLGIYEIEDKLNENLSQLLRNKLAVEGQIKEVNRWRDALYSYADMTPVTGILEIEPRKTDKEVHMKPVEMKFLMKACGLILKTLAADFRGKYSPRTLAAYRTGQVPIPKDIAEILRGYPRKGALPEV